ncbi:MAG TPA: ATP-binding protein [Bryobacteraceae bacterium]|nr:ATP-binding protein [Bryobacteraceae bacterium]
MRNRYLYGSGIALLAILLALLVWQVSFTFGEYGPVTAIQTSVFWAVSTLIFILTVTLGFMLFRTGVKLYIQRQADREGSRIQTKLVAGALALSLLPVVFLVMFSYVILNRNVEKWFSRPAEGVRTNLVDVNRALSMEVRGRAEVLAKWLASVPEVQSEAADFAALCRDYRIAALEFAAPDGTTRALCSMTPGLGDVITARAKIGSNGGISAGELLVTVRPAADLQKTQTEIDRYMSEYGQLAAQKKNIRTLYLLFILAIALFILFVATWIALLLSRQISSPISALLVAASEVRKGNLSHRVQTRAVDELATLVRAFNAMMQELEANSRELESRRRFTEAILESIPTGVISLSEDGRIQRVNRALHGLFPADRVVLAMHLRDLFAAEDATEIQYLMKRARRTGVAGSQIDLVFPGQVLHLAVTVSALPAQQPGAPGFVVVLEDTSELLRAQKAAAWHEVARRIAHELKNPLTPIALSAERIGRILDRGGITADSQRVLRECARTISREVESVKMLADEFSRFSRFPAAKPMPSDLNEIVKNALAVFLGRLDGIDLRIDLAPDPPPVNVDPEQFKRVVVNLVDNAAEAMRESPLKQLLVRTSVMSPDSLELLVADTGCGISAEDKEKLFLPYFSTKERGTGLGLAIVSHILSEHGARIRVEDNRPAGARFYVDIPVTVAAEVEVRA